MLNFTRVSDVQTIFSISSLMLFFFLISLFFPLSSPFLPLPLQSLSYSTVSWLKEGKKFADYWRKILILLSLEQNWNRLLREVSEVQLIETFKTRCHVVEEHI